MLWFPGGSVIKNPPPIVGDTGLIPVLGRSPGEGHDNPLQYSCLENPMDRGACSDEAEMPLMGSCNPASWGWSQETWASNRSMHLLVMLSSLPVTQVWGGAPQRGAGDSRSAAAENSCSAWTGTRNRVWHQRSCWASWLIVQSLHLDGTTAVWLGEISIFLCAWFFLIKWRW